MKSRKFPAFYICLLILILAVIILTEFGKFVLKDVLKEYEDSQPKYVAEDFLKSNFSGSVGKACAKLFAAQVSEYETEESIAAYFDEITAGKEFSLQSVSTGIGTDLQYVVKCDNKKFATFSVVKSGETTAHGFDLYRLSAPLLNEKLLSTFSIQIPVGYSLTVNGLTADEKYCLGDRIETESQAFMPDGVDGVLYTTYAFSKLCSVPYFEVTAPNGAVCEITQSEDGVYLADIVYDQTLADAYADYVIEATKAYACYLQKDAAFSKVSKYMDPSSQLYANIKSSPNWMVIDHKSYAFEDIQTSEFYAYSDDVFSCRVTLTHVLKYPGLEDYRDALDITWYLRNVNGQYLIYNSFTN